MALNQAEEIQDARELLRADGYSSDFKVDLALLRPSGQTGDAFLPLRRVDERLPEKSSSRSSKTSKKGH